MTELFPNGPSNPTCIFAVLPSCANFGKSSATVSVILRMASSITGMNSVGLYSSALFPVSGCCASSSIRRMTRGVRDEIEDVVVREENEEACCRRLSASRICVEYFGSCRNEVNTSTGGGAVVAMFLVCECAELQEEVVREIDYLVHIGRKERKGDKLRPKSETRRIKHNWKHKRLE